MTYVQIYERVCISYRYYVIGLIIAPALFYFPKFFEYEAVDVSENFKSFITCEQPAVNLSLSHEIEDYGNNSTKCTEVITKTYNFTKLQFTPFRQNYYYKQVFTCGYLFTKPSANGG